MHLLVHYNFIHSFLNNLLVCFIVFDSLIPEMRYSSYCQNFLKSLRQLSVIIWKQLISKIKFVFHSALKAFVLNIEEFLKKYINNLFGICIDIKSYLKHNIYYKRVNDYRNTILFRSILILINGMIESVNIVDRSYQLTHWVNW